LAYVVPHPVNQPADKELQAYLKQKLPSYMIPGRFILLDRLPLTPNGKVDRRQMEEIE
jgi:acyl-CoA synthetase (AMP-forming)/AMP-acid ligase II